MNNESWFLLHTSWQRKASNASGSLHFGRAMYDREKHLSTQWKPQNFPALTAGVKGGHQEANLEGTNMEKRCRVTFQKRCKLCVRSWHEDVNHYMCIYNRYIYVYIFKHLVCMNKWYLHVHTYINKLIVVFDIILAKRITENHRFHDLLHHMRICWFIQSVVVVAWACGEVDGKSARINMLWTGAFGNASSSKQTLTH